MKFRNHIGALVHLALAGEPNETKAVPCMLFPEGVTKHRSDFPGGKFTVTAEFCQALVANYEAMGRPRLACNYFHRDEMSSLPVDELVKAGTITGLEYRIGSGVWAQMEWTERARKYIRAGEIDQLSPEWALDYVSKATGQKQGPTLLGLALLNDPLFKEMPGAAAADEVQPAAGVANTNGVKMDRLKLIALLALKADATDADIEAAVTKARDTAAKADESEKLVASANDKLSRVEAALGGELKAAKDEVAKLQASLAERDQADRLKAADVFQASLLAKGVTAVAAAELRELHLSDAKRAEKIAGSLAGTVKTGEVGVPGTGAAMSKEDAQKVFSAAVDKLQAETKLSIREATSRVIRENPELAKHI